MAKLPKPAVPAVVDKLRKAIEDARPEPMAETIRRLRDSPAGRSQAFPTFVKVLLDCAEQKMTFAEFEETMREQSMAKLKEREDQVAAGRMLVSRILPHLPTLRRDVFMPLSCHKIRPKDAWNKIDSICGMDVQGQGIRASPSTTFGVSLGIEGSYAIGGSVEYMVTCYGLFKPTRQFWDGFSLTGSIGASVEVSGFIRVFWSTDKSKPVSLNLNIAGGGAYYLGIDVMASWDLLRMVKDRPRRKEFAPIKNHLERIKHIYAGSFDGLSVYGIVGIGIEASLSLEFTAELTPII